MATLKQKVSGVAVSRTVIANYDDSTVVHNAGTETVAGVKTFTESPQVPNIADASDASMKVANTSFVQSAIVSSASKVITVTGDSGTLFEVDLETMKANKRVMLERDSVVFQYTSTLTDGKMRYTAVNRFVGGMDYLCVILVDAASGDWEYEYSPLVVKTVADLPKTELVMPTGITSDPSYYWCKNNTVHITLNRLKSTTVGEFTIPILGAYTVPNDRQLMGHAYSWDDGSTAGFTRITNLGIRARFFQANRPIWGSIVYTL